MITRNDAVGNLPSWLETLPGLKPAGSGYEARCPAHDDGTASLSVGFGADGRVLLNCHAGCSLDAVLGALGVGTKDLFPNGKRKSGRLGDIVAEYSYQDENGELAYQVLRYEPKTFRQRQPNGSGGWTWKLNGVRRIPYRLPELLENPSSLVLVVEGEKDVDRLRSAGFVATCNPQGAGKWTKLDDETVRRAFNGRPVVVLPDSTLLD